MELKDKIATLISILALVVSVGVFIDSRVESHQAKIEVDAKNSFIAYRLGDKFGIYTVAYLHTNVGTEEELNKFRDDLLKSIQDPQGYADQLGLRINLSELLINYDKSSAFNNRIYSLIYDQILTVHGKEVATSYDAAFWASWTLMNSKISLDKGNGEWLVEEFNQNLYPKIRKLYEILEYPKDIVLKVTNINELNTLALNLRKSLKERYID